VIFVVVFFLGDTTTAALGGLGDVIGIGGFRGLADSGGGG
jgi:hypothetical protein